MIGLLRSEALRFRSRSMVVGLVVAAVLLIVVGFFIAGADASRPSADEIARAEAGYQRCLEFSRMGEEERRAFLFERFDLDDAYISTGWWFDQDGYCDPESPATGFAPGLALIGLPSVLLGVAAFWIGMGLLMGASFVGADWHARSMTTLLTWESRRNRVFLARVGTAGVGVFAIVLFLQVVVTVAFAITSGLRGTWFHVDATWGADMASIVFRASALAGLAAAVGSALGMAARTTAGALGLVFAYGFLEMFMQSSAYHPVMWTFGPSVVAILIQEPIPLGGWAPFADVSTLSPAGAIPHLLGYVALVLLGCWAVFKVRDVS